MSWPLRFFTLFVLSLALLRSAALGAGCDVPDAAGQGAPQPYETAWDDASIEGFVPLEDARGLVCLSPLGASLDAAHAMPEHDEELLAPVAEHVNLVAMAATWSSDLFLPPLPAHVDTLLRPPQA